ncbi:hypothetical protein [Rubritalea tangerina]|uniref:hypothetical protein n=1 Tax=Rubritalea tangerina TaxID=430798 RepID=UPI00360E2D09
MIATAFEGEVEVTHAPQSLSFGGNGVVDERLEVAKSGPSMRPTKKYGVSSRREVKLVFFFKVFVREWALEWGIVDTENGEFGVNCS